MDVVITRSRLALEGTLVMGGEGKSSLCICELCDCLRIDARGLEVEVMVLSVRGLGGDGEEEEGSDGFSSFAVSAAPKCSIQLK